MPVKKKKGGKKKDGSKAIKEKYLPMIYQVPQYEDPDLVTPMVDLIIKLANPVNDLLTLKIKKIHQEISKMHQGAISNILLCRDRYNPEEVLDPQKTLEQCGIFDGEVKFFYDYKPVTSPLLK